jgi:hypothetical protein
MNNIEKNIAAIITIVIDISLIYILLKQNLNRFDYSFVLAILFMHFFFIISVITQYRPIIDLCHWGLMISLGLAIFIKNKFLLILPFLLLLLLPILWSIFGKCIINTDEQNNNGDFFNDTFGLTLTQCLFASIIIISLKLLNIIK